MSRRASQSIAYRGHKTALHKAGMACAIFETFSCCFSKNINIKCLTYAGLCYTLCIITLWVQSADSCPRVYYLSQKTTAFLRTNWMAPLSLSDMEWHAFCAPSSRAWFRQILTATQCPPPPSPKKRKKTTPPQTIYYRNVSSRKLRKATDTPLLRAARPLPSILCKCWQGLPTATIFWFHSRWENIWLKLKHSCTPTMDGLWFCRWEPLWDGS